MLPSNRDPSLSLPRRSLRQRSAPNFLPERTFIYKPRWPTTSTRVPSFWLIARQRPEGVIWGGGAFPPPLPSLRLDTVNPVRKRLSEPTSCILFCSTVMQPFHTSTSTHAFIMHFSIVNYACRPGCVLAPKASWGGVLSACSGIMER